MPVDNRYPYKYTFKTKPFRHQIKALHKGAKQFFFAYFMEMGTGKTKVAIDNAALLFEFSYINALVVIAPKGVYANWSYKEIPLHYPGAYELHHWNGKHTKEADRDRLIALKIVSPNLKILVMNIDAVTTNKGYAFLEEYLKKHKALFVVDESTTIKNHRAKRTLALTKLAKYAPYRRILTGSPVTNSPLDLFGQVNFLQPGALGHTSFYTFRARYAKLRTVTLGSRSFVKVDGYKNLDELTLAVARFSFRCTKDKCLDLPPKIYVSRNVSLSPEQARAYAAMKKESLIILENDALSSAQIALTQMQKLHQIVCGYIKTNDGEIIQLPNPRLDALMQVIEETQGKIVIWANYRLSIASIAESLRKEYGTTSVVEFHGGIEQNERVAGVKAFQEDETTRFFVGTQQAGGMGIDLFASNTTVYYSNTFKLDDRIQSEDRAHRIGQTHSVTYVDLVTPQTVDEKIIKALRNKINLAQIITGDNYREWLI